MYQSPLKVRSRCCLSLHLVRLLAQGASAWKLVRHHRSLTSPVASLSRTEGTKIRLAQNLENLVIDLTVTVDSGSTGFWIASTPQTDHPMMKSPPGRDSYLMGMDCPMGKKDFSRADSQNQS